MIGAILYAAELMRETKEKLKKAGATSEETAKTIEEFNKLGFDLKEMWLKIPGVKRTPNGRYYLACDGKHC